MTTPQPSTPSIKYKILSIVARIIIYFLGFMLISIFIYTPILRLLPDGITKILHWPSKALYSLLSDTSTLSLKKGKTCTQLDAKCLEAFNLEGSIQAGDGEKFKIKLLPLISQYPNINTVCLNSDGGVNEAAAYIIDTIRHYNLNTCVGDIAFDDNSPGADTGIRYTNNCSSACTLILLAGKNRIAVGDRFTLGMHSSRKRTESGSEVQENQKNATNQVSYTSHNTMTSTYETYKDRTLISDEGLKKILVETSRTPSNKMYFAPPEEQMSLGFFTERL